MNDFKKKRTSRIVKITFCWIVLLIATNNASAATINWKGTTSSDWAVASNWSSGTLPVSTDAVQIGIVAFTNQPTVTASESCASILLGTTQNITLTVNSGITLTVSGAITQNPDNGGNFTTTVTGSGSITCASLQVGNSTTFPPVLAIDLTEFISTIYSLHVTGNVTVNSSNFDITLLAIGYLNVTFSLQGGTTTIDGTILTVNTTQGILPLTTATPKFSIDIPSGSALTPVLQLTNANALNTASVAGSIDFYNNTGGTGTSTVYYSGTSQEVYTNTTACLDNTPETYQYLELTGSGTKTPDGGTLSIGADLTSTATSVLFNTNNPTVDIDGSWYNSSSATQGSGNITVSGSLTNDSGGTLTLGTANLYVATNYTNNVGGVYTQSTGTTYFNGSGAQALVDNSTTGTTFKLVDFSGGGTATMSAGANNVNFAVASTGILTMSNSSKLVAGSSSAAYLTLKSDTNGTATVAKIPSGCSITGFVTAQRFVQGSATYDNTTKRWIARNYRLMTSPVNEGIDGSGYYPYSLDYLGAGTIITDCTSTYTTRGGNASLYLFDEHYTPANATFTDGNFPGVTNISNTSASGTITTTDATYGSAKVYAGDGFMMYFRGDNITHLTGTPSKTTYPFVAPESVTFSATGNLNQGSYSVVSFTESAGLLYSTSNAGNLNVRGYNLVGNPYPSSIDWSTFSNTNSAAPIYGYKVNPTVYILDPITGNYDTYNATTGISTGNASKIIPSGQGFFVQANNSSPTLTFTESAKSNSQVTGSNLLMDRRIAAAVVPRGAYRSLMRLNLVTDATNHTDMVIGFNPASTTKFSGNEDAQSFPSSGAYQFISAITSDSVRASVKWVPLPKGTASLVIPLGVSAVASGQYTIQRSDLEAIPALYELWLIDAYKKDSLDIKHNTAYVFDIDLSDSASFGKHRFRVVVRQNPALAVHLLSFSAAKVKGGAQVVWTTENEANYTNFAIERSIDGGTTFTKLDSVASSSLGSYGFMDADPVAGSDSYRLQITDLNGKITYSNVVTLIYAGNSNTLTDASNINVYPNPSNGLINLAIDQQSADDPTEVSSLQSSAISPLLPAPPATGEFSYKITIISMTGSVVKTGSSSSANWQDNVSALAPGTYVIQVNNNKDNSLVGKSVFVKM